MTDPIPDIAASSPFAFRLRTRKYVVWKGDTHGKVYDYTTGDLVGSVDLNEMRQLYTEYKGMDCLEVLLPLYPDHETMQPHNTRWVCRKEYLAHHAPKMIPF